MYPEIGFDVEQRSKTRLNSVTYVPLLVGLCRDYAEPEARKRHHRVTCFRFVDPPVGALSSESTWEGMLRSVSSSVTLVRVFKKVEIDNFTQLGLCAICRDR